MEGRDSFSYHHSELPAHCFSRFEDMKRRNKFCDITINFGSHSIVAHRLVLSAAIPYFRDLLETSNEEEERNISVMEIDPWSLEALIDFAYTGKVIITADNVEKLLTAASSLKMDEVREACACFLAEQLTPETVFPTHELAQSHNCTELLEDTENYICHHFDELANVNECLNLCFTCLEKVLGRDDLHCSSEEKVFEFIMNWVKISPEERKCHLPQLLRKIRMPLLSPEYLTFRVCKEELICPSVECRNIVEDARTYHFLPHRRSEILPFEMKPRSLKKKNVKINQIADIYATSRTAVMTVEHFDPQTEEWDTQKVGTCFQLYPDNRTLCAARVDLARNNHWNLQSDVSTKVELISIDRFEACRCSFGAAVLENKLYFCGGVVENRATDIAECYDLETAVLYQIEAMLERRNYPGVVALGGFLHVFGGCDEYGCQLDTVEQYDSECNEWISMPPMLTGRFGMGYAVLGNKLYVCGGMGERTLACAEVYDFDDDEWTAISPMKTPRFKCSLIARGGKLYAAGGYDEDKKPLDTVEIYDPRTCEWIAGPPLRTCMKFL